jgi:hypothetical protein
LRRSVFAVKRKQVKANLCDLASLREKEKNLCGKKKKVKANLCDLASLR